MDAFTLLTALVTILGVFIANVGMIIPLFIWVRAETRADARHNDSKLDSTRELVRAIHEEMKDFHNRIIKIESREK